MNPNAYIPKDKQEQEEEKDDLGRELTFLPDVIFTPVLTSKRTHPKPYPRLSQDDVDDLAETISKMLITDEKKEEPIKKASRAKDPVSAPLGRYEVEVIAKKSNRVVRVSRSLRLT